MLAVAVGVELISKVPPLLHTPLMSGSNAISGITLVGAIGAAVFSGWDANGVLAFLAVTFGTINVVGGYGVTHRMLQMFKKQK
ncbi:MAG: NAD(P) transhydrogenase subunit alpha [Planctomycetes bacterium]|nr:NAD(P) transhydrogenase subunit alpha [Planctomycetota bacterium]